MQPDGDPPVVVVGVGHARGRVILLSHGRDSTVVAAAATHWLRRAPVLACSRRHQLWHSAPMTMVITSYGTVSGEQIDGVTRFLGIPYAASPTGPLRFAAPEPPEPWDGVRECTAFGATPPKPDYAAPFDTILPEPSIPGDGLAQPERLDARPDRYGPGHGVDPRRRVRQRQLSRADVRRSRLRARRRRPGHDQLPARHRRIRAAAGRASARQPRPARPGRRAGMGQGQHRRFRRRPGQRDDLRRVRGRDERDHAARHAAGPGPVRQGHRAERRSPGRRRPARRHAGDRRAERRARLRGHRGQPGRPGPGQADRGAGGRPGRHGRGAGPGPVRPDAWWPRRWRSSRSSTATCSRSTRWPR